MRIFQDSADFLHLFSEESNGLKYLTHDFSSDTDYVDYIYNCEKLILDMREKYTIEDSIYNLVRGFVFGPSWIDYKGNVHKSFVSSESFVRYYESTGQHPLRNPVYEMEFEDFRNSIRFRSSKLEKYILELKEDMPQVHIEVERNLKGADIYTNTGIIRKALKLIIESMKEYDSASSILLGYAESTYKDFTKSIITIEHKDSFPVHSFVRDREKLLTTNGGTLGVLRNILNGICEWSIVSKWPDQNSPIKWNILKSNDSPEMEEIPISNGFTHIISIIHKP